MHVVDGVAVYLVLSSSWDQFDSSDDPVDFVCLCSWSNQQAGASVHDSSATSITSNSLSFHHHTVHVDLPVSLPLNRHVGHLTLIEHGVRSSKDQFSSNLSIWVSVQPEGENRFLNQSLVNHGVEGRNDTKNCNLRESHAKNSIKLSGNKSKARFMGGLGKGLVFDTDSSNATGVSGQVSGHTPGSIVDFELSTVWLVGTGLGAVIAVVGTAGQLPDRAGCGGDPQPL